MFPACPLLVASGSSQQNARTQSGASYPDVIPARTSAAAFANLGEIVLPPLDAETPTPYRPRTEPRRPHPQLVASASAVRKGPRRSVGRHWQATAKSPNLAVSPSPYPTTLHPRVRRPSAIS